MTTPIEARSVVKNFGQTTTLRRERDRPAAKRSASRSPALAMAPKVIFADEPTGSLDSLTGER